MKSRRAGFDRGQEKKTESNCLALSLALALAPAARAALPVHGADEQRDQHRNRAARPQRRIEIEKAQSPADFLFVSGSS